MAQFSNAQHVTVHGGTFNSAKEIHIHNRDSEFGLHALSQVVSHGATHDSAERYPPANCHPDTRKAVRQIIMDWIHNESSALPFFWLYGPAGVGKTAILQAIAEFLCECDGILGGSFFFSRGKQGRDHGRYLFSTIAYQLALNVPGLRQYVNRVMEANPTLHTKSIAVQLQSLIVDALRSLPPLPQRSYLVIIDGLDECQDKATQQMILRLLCNTITSHKLPLRFLIGSRPESHIRASFDQKGLYTVTHRVVLDETFSPGRDIQVFLQDGFAEICTNHADLLSHVNRPWPGEGIIDLLVQRSSGQFIYAATVLKFVGADFYSPTKQLALILKHDSMAFSDLDQLYTQILSVYPSTTNVVQILGIIVAFGNRTLTPEVIEDILEMEEGEVMLVLRGLSSLIAFVGVNNEEYRAKRDYFPNVGSVYLIHASFRDYLVDSSRSGPFHVNEQEHKNRATTSSFFLITKWIGRSWMIPLTTRLPHNKTWDYFKSSLPDHFADSPKLVKDTIMIRINYFGQGLWEMSRDGAVGVLFTALHCLLHILEAVGCSHLSRPFHYLLDQSFISEFSKSRDMVDFLRFLPGIVVQDRLTMQGMADLYRVKMDLLERFSKWTIEPLTPSESDLWSPSHSSYKFKLERYLSGFLQDRDRSQLYYCDPMLHHVFICRQFLSLLDGSNAFYVQSDELPEYVRYNLYDHLCAATGQDILGNDHAVVDILNSLDRITYYHLDANQTHFSHLARSTIRPILRWVDRLNSLLKGATVCISKTNLVKRLRQSADRIYRVMLCIETHGYMTTITICSPLRIGPRLTSPTVNPSVVQLSWELLALVSDGIIPSSFTDFMTTPGRAGPLYINPDVYHTQITEYSLETNFRFNNSQPSPFSRNNDHKLKLDWSFEKHISHALPTEMIIYLLRSIFLKPIRHYATPITDLLEIMIKWLEGFGSERPSDLYDHLRGEQRKLALTPL